MTTYNLNLAKNYCDHWGLWEAVREILQNGEDQLTLNSANEISVHYNEKTKVLSVSNKDSVLERKSLLFGGTTKKGDENTIGKFGEGYKIALLIFQKLGIDVVIKNYAKNERWTTEMRPDVNYDNEHVLKVKIKKYFFKRLPDHNLSFEMKGIEKKDWEMIKEKYLREQTINKLFKAKNENEILFDKAFKGKVFVNGLFVEELKGDYKYGYNFHPSQLKLDRDRQSVVGFDFNYALKNLFKEYAKQGQKEAEEVLEIIRSDFRDLSKEDYSFYIFNSPLLEVAEKSLKTYGDNAYPVTTQKEVENIQEHYKNVKPVFVSPVEKAILKNEEKYKTINNFVKENKDIEKNLAQLTPESILRVFLLENETEMFYEAREAFEKLIEQSKNWEPKQHLPIENLKECKESYTLLNQNKKEKNEIVKEESEVLFDSYFDDDIPF